MLGAFYPGQAYPAQAPEYPPIQLGPSLDLCEATFYSLTPERTVLSLMGTRTVIDLPSIHGVVSLIGVRTVSSLEPTLTVDTFCAHED